MNSRRLVGLVRNHQRQLGGFVRSATQFRASSKNKSIEPPVFNFASFTSFAANPRRANTTANNNETNLRTLNATSTSNNIKSERFRSVTLPIKQQHQIRWFSRSIQVHRERDDDPSELLELIDEDLQDEMDKESFENDFLIAKGKKNYRKALHLLHQMARIDPALIEPQYFTDAMDMCLQQKKPRADPLFEVYRMMDKYGVPLTLHNQVCVLFGYVLRGNIKEANKWFHRIHAAGEWKNYAEDPEMNLNTWIQTELEKMEVALNERTFQTIHERLSVDHLAPEPVEEKKPVVSQELRIENDKIDFLLMTALEDIDLNESLSPLEKLNRKIKVCEKKKELVRALKFFGEIDQPNLDSYRNLLKVCVMCKDARTLDVFEAMIEAGFKPDADIYLSLIKFYSMTEPDMRKPVAIVRHLLANEKYDIADINFFNAVLDCCADNKDQLGAVQVFDIIQTEASKNPERFTPNVTTYNNLMRCFAEAGDLRTFRMFDEMKSKNMEYDETTYNNLILSCAKSGDLDRAKRVLNEMIHEGFTPNVVSHNIIFNQWYLTNVERVIRATTAQHKKRAKSKIKKTATSAVASISLRANMK